MSEDRQPILQSVGVFERIQSRTVQLAGSDCEILPLQPLPHRCSHVVASYDLLEFSAARLPACLARISAHRGKATILLPFCGQVEVLVNGQLLQAGNLILIPPGGVAFVQASSSFSIACYSVPGEHHKRTALPEESMALGAPPDLSKQLRRIARALIDATAQSSDNVPREADLGGLVPLLAGLREALDGLTANSGRLPLIGAERIRLMKLVDEFIGENLSNPIYLGSVAELAGVSVRTIHNVTVAMSGLPFTRLLKARRAWNAYRELLTGVDHRFIKTVALKNGFWHLGDFSRAYEDQFGELPSDTRRNAALQETTGDDPRILLRKQFDRPVQCNADINM
jgi:AraC-like DNA-binding protein